MEITYVTGNWDKIESAKQILEPLGIEINHIKMDTIEIQADDTEEIAKYSAKLASEKLKCNVLKNDTGFYVEALGSFPDSERFKYWDTSAYNKLAEYLKNKEKVL